MIAARFHEHGGPEVLKIESIPIPEINDNQLLVEMRATALNHLDIWVRRGIPGVPLPMIPGSDGAGIVRKVGNNISAYLPGDEIMIQPLLYCGECDLCRNGHENHCSAFGILGETCNGTCANFIAVEEKNIIKKPPQLSFIEAAGFSLVAQTSYEMLVMRAKIKSGETVLVWGASSGVGSMAVQIAKTFDCHVIAISSTEEKCKKIQSLGADKTINHKNGNVYENVMDYTNGLGVNIVFEHVGQATWDTSMKVLKKGGRVVTCGATTGQKANINLTHVFYKQLSILGSTMGSVKAMSDVVKLLNRGKIKPVVDKVFSLESIQDAHLYLESGNQFGKVIIEGPNES
ncbi:MAG: zinc-binding dehydrogenase [Candidatus Marinimicrobia bacterium]|nr:zinc-binding dehydrogenase [Candidatus Neomarinimicrobiota bacterium]